MTKRTPSFIRAYAHALIECGIDQPTIMLMYNSLTALDNIFRSYPYLLQALNNSQIPFLNRDTLARDLSERLNLHPYITNFFRLLVRNHHLHYLKTIAKRVMPALETAQGIVKTAVTSARPLPKERTERLLTWLKSRTPMEPDIIFELDASLLGGIIIEYGAYRLDASLRSQLHRLSMTLKGSF